MGCFPQRTLPRYHSLPPMRGRIQRNSDNNSSNMDSIYVPINISQSHINTRGNRPYNYSPVKKKTAQVPSNNRNSYNNRFKRQQSIDKNNEKDRRQLSRKGKNEEIPQSLQKKKGTVIELPFRQHIITKIETPSQSVKSSVLSLLEHNPSILFMKLGDKDIQKVFSPSKYHDDKSSRLSFKSMSPKRSQSIPLLK